MSAFRGTTPPTHLWSSVNAESSNNPGLWHLRWCVMSQLTDSPRKGEGDWKHQHLSQHSTIRQHSILIYLHYALWELWLCYAALFTSVQHRRLIQTWNIALILINLNWINEIIIGNTLATWMQWWNRRNMKLMFYFSSLVLTFSCSWT